MSHSGTPDLPVAADEIHPHLRARLNRARLTWEARSVNASAIQIQVLRPAGQSRRGASVSITYDVAGEITGPPTAFRDLLLSVSEDVLTRGVTGQCSPHVISADGATAAEHRLAQHTVMFMAGVTVTPALLSLHRDVIRRGWAWTAQPGRHGLSAYVQGRSDHGSRGNLGQACMSTSHLTLPLTAALARAYRQELTNPEGHP